jgi:KDO2-lipid IV(A) lauroyltransferase
MCRVVVELIFTRKIIRQGKIREIIRIEGEENQKNAARKKKGIVFITAHYGVWELLFHANYLFSQDFVPIHVVVRPSDNPYLDTLLNKPREMLGSRTVPKKKSLKPLLKALKSNETVAILIDQNVCREEGVFVDFFGKKAATTFGATLLALRTDAPVVPGFMRNDPATGTYTIRFSPEIPLVRTGNLSEEIQINTQNFIKSVENLIRERPEDWLWVHKRWKTRPAGEEEKIY